jgi:hypothetical protein
VIEAVNFGYRVVVVRDCVAPTPVTVEGSGLHSVGEVAEPGSILVEVSVAVTDPVVGQRRRARAIAAGSAVEFDFVVAEPVFPFCLSCIRDWFV